MSGNRSTIRTLFVSNLVLMFGFQIWRVVFNNLAVQDLGVEADAIGVIQSIREIPGLMGFLFVLMVAWLGSEMRVMGANVVIIGLGVVLTGLSQNLPALILGTLVTSIGFHYFVSGSSAVLLQLSSQEETPEALGRLGSVSALAALLGTACVWGAALVLDNRRILLIVGAFVTLAGLALLPRMNIARRYEQKEEKARQSVRREYWLYYVLTFLMGARRHILTTFTIFLLVSVHGLETDETARLFMINSIVSFVASPRLGRLVARFGEQRMLALSYVCLFGVFVGYATIDSTQVLIALFVLDNLFLGFSLALNSYFQKIAVIPQDITPNMSLAQSINHVAAVIVPAIGGWMWARYGLAAPFLAGAALTLITLLLVGLMRTPRREAVGAMAG